MGNEVRREPGPGSDRSKKAGARKAGGSIHDRPRQDRSRWRVEADVGEHPVFSLDRSQTIGCVGGPGGWPGLRESVRETSAKDGRNGSIRVALSFKGSPSCGILRAKKRAKVTPARSM